MPQYCYLIIIFNCQSTFPLNRFALLLFFLRPRTVQIQLLLPKLTKFLNIPRHQLLFPHSRMCFVLPFNLILIFLTSPLNDSFQFISKSPIAELLFFWSFDQNFEFTCRNSVVIYLLSYLCFCLLIYLLFMSLSQKRFFMAALLFLFFLQFRCSLVKSLFFPFALLLFNDVFSGQTLQQSAFLLQKLIISLNHLDMLRKFIFKLLLTPPNSIASRLTFNTEFIEFLAILYFLVENVVRFCHMI